MTGLILITGASGKTGSAIARDLEAAGVRVRRAGRSAAPGTVRFDWHDPSTFDAALAGVERLYLLAPIGDNAPLDTVAPFIEKALAAGTRRFVLLSSTQIAEGGPAMGQIHAHLRRVAPEYAVLRPSWFMPNFVSAPHVTTIRNEDAIYSATETGRVPFVAVEDIAAVGAHVLLQDDAPEPELMITGPELLSYDDVARMIGEARGRPVRHIRIRVDELADRHAALGMPRDYAETLASLDGVIARGGEERLSDVVPRLTGRRGVDFRFFSNLHRAAWTV